VLILLPSFETKSPVRRGNPPAPAGLSFPLLVPAARTPMIWTVGK
jgi:hypothetical protein